MSGGLEFSPLLPPPFLWGAGLAILIMGGWGLFRRARGGWLRLGLAAFLLFFLLGPQSVEEKRRSVPSVALLVSDETASQEMTGRINEVRALREEMEKRLKALPGLEVRTVTVRSGQATDGTRLFAALEAETADLPARRVAGSILLTDGLIHDMPEKAPAFPVHALITGRRSEGDRRLIVEEAPAYGLVGGLVEVAVRIEDKGAKPGESARLTVKREDGRDIQLTAPLNRTTRIPLPVGRGGSNLLFITAEAGPHELSPANNSSALTLSGVRDRLKVALISGVPHMGGRAWRNLLKSDPAVDLVHFTIMRSPDKVDGIPSHELSLIAFPTRELFQERLGEFDLLVFDRHGKRSLMSDQYHANVAAHVRSGGALLMAVGPEFATSAADEPRSPLLDLLPIETGRRVRVIEGDVVPTLTEAGRRHPVTRNLPPGPWGGWLRRLDVKPKGGEVLIADREGHPLLIVDRVGSGRVAFLAGDRAWLWEQGYEGGGPYGELMRRLVHWLMKEPELEETGLKLAVDGDLLRAEWRGMGAPPAALAILSPDGKTGEMPFSPGKTPGKTDEGAASASMPMRGPGLYQAEAGGRKAFLHVAGADEKESGELAADDSRLEPLRKAGGGIFWTADGPFPDLRLVEPGARASGKGWLGLSGGGDYTIEGVRSSPLIPPAAALVLLLVLAAAAWKREGD